VVLSIQAAAMGEVGEGVEGCWFKAGFGSLSACFRPYLGRPGGGAALEKLLTLTLAK